MLDNISVSTQELPRLTRLSSFSIDRSIALPGDAFQQGILDPVQIVQGTHVAPISQRLFIESSRSLFRNQLLEGIVLPTPPFGILIIPQNIRPTR